MSVNRRRLLFTPKFIAGLKARQLIAQAERLEDQAAQLRSHAAVRRAKRRAEAARAAQLGALATLPDSVASFTAGGLELEAAKLATAARFNVPLETVDFYMKSRDRENLGLIRARRARLVLLLARRGWKNAEIGRHPAVGMHPNSVSRLLQKLLREAPRQAV